MPIMVISGVPVPFICLPMLHQCERQIVVHALCVLGSTNIHRAQMYREHMLEPARTDASTKKRVI